MFIVVLARKCVCHPTIDPLQNDMNVVFLQNSSLKDYAQEKHFWIAFVTVSQGLDIALVGMIVLLEGDQNWSSRFLMRLQFISKYSVIMELVDCAVHRPNPNKNDFSS